MSSHKQKTRIKLGGVRARITSVGEDIESYRQMSPKAAPNDDYLSFIESSNGAPQMIFLNAI